MRFHDLNQLADELPELLEHRRLLALELDLGMEVDEDHRASLQRRVALLGSRIQHAEVAVSVARRSGGPMALSAAQRAVSDAWRVAGSLV